MSEADWELVLTRHGVLALMHRGHGEVMHPGPGPLAEARALYRDGVGLPGRLERASGQPKRALSECTGGDVARRGQRLASRTGRPVRLLDVGLGAGTNAAVAITTALDLDAPLEVVSIETDPTGLAAVLQSGKGEAFGLDHRLGTVARKLLDSGVATVGPVSWRLVQGDVLEVDPGGPFDLIYWDPFSNKVEPRLWSVEAFRKTVPWLAPGGRLVTYSSATMVRVAMLLAGLAVGAGPGLGTRNESTHGALATKDLDLPLGRRFLQRLERSTAAFPADAAPDAREILRRMLEN